MAAGLSLSHTELGLASTAGLNLQMSINLRSTLESDSPLHHLLEGSWGKGGGGARSWPGGGGTWRGKKSRGGWGGGGAVSGCAGMDLEAAEVHVVLLNTNY